jgi:hypothetical protein
MVSIGIEHHEVSHPIRTITRFNLNDDALALNLSKVVVDFIAEDRGCAASHRSLMKVVAAQMERYFVAPDACVLAKSEVLTEAENFSVVPQRILEIVYSEDWCDASDVHRRRMLSGSSASPRRKEPEGHRNRPALANSFRTRMGDTPDSRGIAGPEERCIPCSSSS